MKKKRFYMLLLACLGATALMAQSLRVKNRVIDRDYYPVDSAKVVVKGTSISTYTDKDGYFVLEGVPAYLDSIGVVKGKKDYDGVIPIGIEMKRELVDRFSWYVKAGGGYPFLDMQATAGGESYEFFGGAGMDIRLGRHWSYQTGLNLVYRKVKGMPDSYSFSDFDYRSYDMGTLEVPLLLALRFPVGMSNNLVLRFGGYLDVGLWGKLTESSYDGKIKYDLFDENRISGGFAYGLGLELKRHWMIGFTGHVGWTSYDYDEGFTSIAFEAGYRF